MDNTSFGQATAPAPAPSSADRQMELLQLENSLKSGANWFYWIAGLTLVNTVAAMSGSTWRFILGLAITQFVDAVAQDLGSTGRVAALVIDFFIAGLFVVFGVFANKQMKWAFIVGMGLFGLDTLLGVLAQDWIGVAFHVFALWAISRGYAAMKKLQAEKTSVIAMSQTP